VEFQSIEIQATKSHKTDWNRLGTSARQGWAENGPSRATVGMGKHSCRANLGEKLTVDIRLFFIFFERRRAPKLRKAQGNLPLYPPSRRVWGWARSNWAKK